MSTPFAKQIGSRMAERVGFGHEYFSAGKFRDPRSAPVVPARFESVLATPESSLRERYGVADWMHFPSNTF